MRWLCLIPAALLLPLAGCDDGARNIDAELDADFTSGTVLLSCKQSSSGTCHAAIYTDTGLVSIEAAAGSTATGEGLTDEARYCVDVVTPQFTQCHPRPLAPGKQIVRKVKMAKASAPANAN